MCRTSYQGALSILSTNRDRQSISPCCYCLCGNLNRWCCTSWCGAEVFPVSGLFVDLGSRGWVTSHTSRQDPSALINRKPCLNHWPSHSSLLLSHTYISVIDLSISYLRRPCTGNAQLYIVPHYVRSAILKHPLNISEPEAIKESTTFEEVTGPQ